MTFIQNIQTSFIPKNTSQKSGGFGLRRPCNGTMFYWKIVKGDLAVILQPCILVIQSVVQGVTLCISIVLFRTHCIQNKTFETPRTRPRTRLWMTGNTGLFCDQFSASLTYHNGAILVCFAFFLDEGTKKYNASLLFFLFSTRFLHSEVFKPFESIFHY